MTALAWTIAAGDISRPSKPAPVRHVNILAVPLVCTCGTEHQIGTRVEGEVVTVSLAARCGCGAPLDTPTNRAEVSGVAAFFFAEDERRCQTCGDYGTLDRERVDDPFTAPMPCPDCEGGR